jgi:hypothetical protein
VRPSLLNRVFQSEISIVASSISVVRRVLAVEGISYRGFDICCELSVCCEK